MKDRYAQELLNLIMQIKVLNSPIILAAALLRIHYEIWPINEFVCARGMEITKLSATFIWGNLRHQNKNINWLAIKNGIDIGLLQSRLTHPVRDIAHSCAFLHDIGHALEDLGVTSWFYQPSGLAGRKKAVRHKGGMWSVKLLHPCLFRTLCLLCTFQSRLSSTAKQSLASALHSSLLIGQHWHLTSQDAWR